MAYLFDGATQPDRLTFARGRIRRRLGQREDTVLVDNDDIDDALAEALRETNKHWPIYGIGSFPSVAGQQLYSGILPAGARELITVFWSQQAIDAGCDLQTMFGGYLGSEFVDVTEDGIRYVAQPSTMLIVQRNASYLRRYFGRSASIADRDSVYLDPAPGSSGTNIYFVYTTDRFDAAENVTKDIPEAATFFMAKALQTGSETLGQGRNAMTSARGADGIGSTNRAAEFALTSAARYEQQAVDNLLLAPSIWSEF